MASRSRKIEAGPIRPGQVGGSGEALVITLEGLVVLQQLVDHHRPLTPGVLDDGHRGQLDGAHHNPDPGLLVLCRVQNKVMNFFQEKQIQKKKNRLLQPVWQG